MSFRPGQSGAVERKGKRWIGRFYEDVPGSTERKRTSVTLGSVSDWTKSEARRKLRSMLEKNGLNEDKHLERITNSRTFRQEAEWWRENKLSLYKPSVQETMGSHLDTYLIPRLGDFPLEQITERKVQELVAVAQVKGQISGRLKSHSANDPHTPQAWLPSRTSSGSDMSNAIFDPVYDSNSEN